MSRLLALALSFGLVVGCQGRDARRAEPTAATVRPPVLGSGSKSAGAVQPSASPLAAAAKEPTSATDQCGRHGAIPEGVAAGQGFTCFVPVVGSRVVYVSSSSGKDEATGISPAHAVKTLAKGISLLRDGRHDFLLLRRGDTWQDETLNALGSGENKQRPVVVASYGSSPERPRLGANQWVLDHNGEVKNYQALLGLEIMPTAKVPGKAPIAKPSSGLATATTAAPAGVQAPSAQPAGSKPPGDKPPGDKPAGEKPARGGLRFVGSGTGILVEDCHLKYAEIIVQSFRSGRYHDVTLRRNVIERAYHPETCGTGPKYRPSGVYSFDVEGFTLEENVLDHNGWNVEEVPGACATMYNHNLYLNAKGLIVRDNVLSRASSMGLKLASAERGGLSDALVEGNVFLEGEIGISAGGNGKGPARFIDLRVLGNVFWGLGSTKPTNREVAWGVELTDDLRAEISGNLFARQTEYTNSFGVHIGGSTQEEITVRGNTFVDVNGGAVVTRATEGFSNVKVTDNAIYLRQKLRCVLAYWGELHGVVFSGNAYGGPEDASVICHGSEQVDAKGWADLTGDRTGKLKPIGARPLRTPMDFAAAHGLEASMAGLLGALTSRRAGSWSEELSPRALREFLQKQPLD
jgi:hypothetical protein